MAAAPNATRQNTSTNGDVSTIRTKMGMEPQMTAANPTRNSPDERLTWSGRIPAPALSRARAGASS